MIEDTQFRDQSQVVSRWNHTTNLLQREQVPKNALGYDAGRLRSRSRVPTWSIAQIKHNILMVDQLWLWLIPDESKEFFNIITCFPTRDGALPDDTIDNIQDMILDERESLMLDDVTQPILKILSVCLDAFDPHQQRDSLQFLKFFESAVGYAVSGVFTVRKVNCLEVLGRKRDRTIPSVLNRLRLAIFSSRRL
jgi:hypothetical protein